MKVELYYLDGCPSWQRARENLERALQLEQLSVQVEAILVADSADVQFGSMESTSRDQAPRREDTAMDAASTLMAPVRQAGRRSNRFAERCNGNAETETLDGTIAT